MMISYCLYTNDQAGDDALETRKKGKKDDTFIAEKREKAIQWLLSATQANMHKSYLH